MSAPFRALAAWTAAGFAAAVVACHEHPRRTERDPVIPPDSAGSAAAPPGDAAAMGAGLGAAAPNTASEPARPGPTLEPATLEIDESERQTRWESGLWLRVFQLDGGLSELTELLPGQTPNVSRVVADLDLGEERRDFGLDSNYLSILDGALHAPEEGVYGMRLSSDDGSSLSIDGRIVLRHDGLHSFTSREGEIGLARGWHRIELRHFEAGGGAQLRLEWRTPRSAEFERIPEAALATQAGIVRLTAPGPKRAVRALVRGAPGDRRDLDGVHPAYRLERARPAHFEPRVGGLAFLPDGRLLVATWDALGAVYLLSNLDAPDANRISVKRIAAGLAEPLGLAVLDGRIFVLQKQELTELIDVDGDELIDEYRAIASGWEVSDNFHEFAFGLVERDGFLYANLAVAIQPGGASVHPQLPGRGGVLRIDPRDGSFTEVAHGLRTPNGIGIGPGGAIFLTDNQGDWLPSSKLLRLEPGAFYGSRAVLGDAAAGLTVTPPVLWLPQDEIGNSPSEPTLLPAGHGPYSGQLVFGDVTRGGVQRTALEEVDGAWQGAVFRFTQGLEAGVNRLRAAPDGALYVGGIGSTGNWGQAGKQSFGLERLRYLGEAPLELLSVRARADGFELEFTRALERGLGGDPTAYEVEQWRYEATATYGGPKLDIEALRVGEAVVSADRKRVLLRVLGLREGRVVHLRLAGAFFDEAGNPPWTTEAWYTLNRLPREPLDTSALERAPAHDAAPIDEGWRELFDGRTLAGWRGFRKDAPPAGWRVEDGAIVRGDGGGDLISEASFGDFEFEWEWRVAPGANSGVMFHVDEDHDYPWQTGPEFQILDNQLHADGKNPLTSAGANYALDAPPFDATLPVGSWNRARLKVQGAWVEHWLNGRLQCRYERWCDAWNAKVAASKFAQMPDYGKNRRGHLVLQDHGDRIGFRRLRLREL